MCAVFGFLDYKGKVSNAVLKKLIHYLSIAAEVRGTDATGIATSGTAAWSPTKSPSRLTRSSSSFPGTRERSSGTPGSRHRQREAKLQQPPVRGTLWQRGVRPRPQRRAVQRQELRREQHLPPTSIETDSYVAVQLLEQGQQLDKENIRRTVDWWKAALSLRF